MLSRSVEGLRASNHAKWWNPSASTKGLALLFASATAQVIRSIA